MNLPEKINLGTAALTALECVPYSINGENASENPSIISLFIVGAVGRCLASYENYMVK